MHQPEGFEVKGKEEYVCKLEKSLYGLKQAPRQWYHKFDTFMITNKFVRFQSNHCVYVKKTTNGNYVILLLYVDDMLVAGSSMQDIVDIKKTLANTFEMKDLGEAKQILGMKITRDKQNHLLRLSQEGYIDKVLKRFNMKDAKSITTPLAKHFKLTKHLSPKTDK